MGLIYLIYEDNLPKYVGQTISTVEERWKQHQTLARTNKGFALHSAMRKKGIEHFSIIILQDQLNSSSELNAQEKFWIKEFRTHVTQQGYNLTWGGETSSDSLKKKCYQYDLEGNFLQEFESVSEAARAVTGLSQVSNILKVLQNKLRTAYGFRWSYSKVNKLPVITSKHTGSKKRVYQYTKDGQLLKEYESTAEAARTLGKNPSPIRNAASGNRLTAYGYKWSYDYIMSRAGY